MFNKKKYSVLLHVGFIFFILLKTQNCLSKENIFHCNYNILDNKIELNLKNSLGHINERFVIFSEAPLGHTRISYNSSVFLLNLQQVMDQLGNIFHVDSIPNRVTFYTISGSSFQALFCPKLQKSDEAILLISEELLDDERLFAQKIFHELIHSIFLKEKIIMPHWLEEGFSVFLETTYFDISGTNIDREHLERPWISLSFRSHDNSKNSKEDLKSYYSHAYMFVKYIHARLNIQDIRLFIRVLIGLTNEQINKYFIDFSLAKYINRQQYSSDSENEVNKYFVSNQDMANFSIRTNTQQKLSAILISEKLVAHQPASTLVYWVTFTTDGGIDIRRNRPSFKQYEKQFIIAINPL